MLIEIDSLVILIVIQIRLFAYILVERVYSIDLRLWLRAHLLLRRALIVVVTHIFISWRLMYIIIG